LRTIKNKTFRFEKTFIAEVEIIAHKNNVSTNEFIIQCIRYAINNMEEETGKEE